MGASTKTRSTHRNLHLAFRPEAAQIGVADRAAVFAGALPEVPELIAAVQGGDLVALGQGWIVEDAVDEVVDRCLERDRHLADVDQLRGTGADRMDPQDLAGLL